jgi:hypothetical protein
VRQVDGEGQPGRAVHRDVGAEHEFATSRRDPRKRRLVQVDPLPLSAGPKGDEHQIVQCEVVRVREARDEVRERYAARRCKDRRHLRDGEVRRRLEDSQELRNGDGVRRQQARVRQRLDQVGDGRVRAKLVEVLADRAPARTGDEDRGAVVEGGDLRIAERRVAKRVAGEIRVAERRVS